MTAAPTDSLTLTRRVLRVLLKLNVLAGLLILGFLIATVLAEDTVMTALDVRSDEGRDTVVFGMRMVMVVGIVAVPIAHLILGWLLRIVDTVDDGDPFVLPNARRLRAIAFALLALEVLHLAVGAIALGVSTRAQPLDLDWSFSPTRWIAVLLLFVLARVFEQGTRMRDELEATV